MHTTCNDPVPRLNKTKVYTELQRLVSSTMFDVLHMMREEVCLDRKTGFYCARKEYNIDCLLNQQIDSVNRIQVSVNQML